MAQQLRILLQCRRQRILCSISGSERSPKEGIATHSSIFAWEITWTEEPGGLQSMGLQRVRHDWALTHLISFYIIMRDWIYKDNGHTTYTNRDFTHSLPPPAWETAPLPAINSPGSQSAVNQTFWKPDSYPCDNPRSQTANSRAIDPKWPDLDY